MAGPPATIDKPLSISIRASHGDGAEASQTGRLHVGELRPDMVSGDQQFVAVLASSLNSPPIANHEELAIEGFLTGLNAGGELHLSEVMKQGFREANKLIHQATKASAPSGTEGVAMLAMLTRGKFATLGLVGPDRAYLLRANRLTQLTRDQRVARPKSRRKSDIEQQQAQAGSATAVQLLGEQERLDSRSPAIFEIALLPEDRLGLVSRGVLDAIPEERILTALGSGIDEGAGMLTAIPARTADAPVLAAVLQVAPSREAPAYVPAPSPAPSSVLWTALILLVALIAIAAAVFFLVL